MRIEHLKIRLPDAAGGGNVRGAGAELTCLLKDNTEGKPDARRKAVLICPGGCYEFCSTREAEPVAFQFLAMDCQAFVLNYSTAPNPFPTALLELMAAMAVIREHAKEWHIDPDQIYPCGFSAGGHLAASLGVFWDREFLLNPLGIKAEQARPNGLILAYPVISSGAYAHEGSFTNLLGLPGTPPVLKNAPPITRDLLSLELQAGPQVPPVFLWHTDTDQTVPVENSLLFAMALKPFNVSLELHIFPEGRHGLALASQETDKDQPEDGKGPYTVPTCQSWIPLVKNWLTNR